MRSERIWLSMAIYRFYLHTTSFLASATASEDGDAEIRMAWQDTVVSAARVLNADRDHGQSLDDEDAALFDEILRTEGHSDDECAQARNVRQGVLLLANKMLDESGLRRGDDPLNSDPGGGMRSPDYEPGDDQP